MVERAKIDGHLCAGAAHDLVRLTQISLLIALTLLVQSFRPGLPVEMTCPVGGAVFWSNHTASSYSTYGSRPDGKAFTNWVSPPPLPECRDNNLPVFADDFSDNEIRELASIIVTPEYAALIRNETIYYRAAWLSRRIRPASLDTEFLQLASIWEAEDGSMQRARYLTEFAEHMSRREAQPDNLDWIELQLRAANARRETLRSAEALAILDALPRAALDVVVPERIEVPLGRGLLEVQNEAAVEEATRRRYLLSLLDNLRAAVLRGDATIEPLDLIPPEFAAWRCEGLNRRERRLPPASTVCSSERVVYFIELARRNQQRR